MYNSAKELYPIITPHNMAIHKFAPACMQSIWQLPASDLIMQLANKLVSVLALSLVKPIRKGSWAWSLLPSCSYHSQSDSLIPVKVEAL